MTLRFTHLRLLVPDVNACARFYRDILGLELLWTDLEGNYASFRTGETVLALHRQEAMAEAVGSTHLPSFARCQDPVALIFAVEDLELAYRELKARGVAFVTEPQDRPEWGLRTAHFRDPAGNLLEINSPRPA